MLKIIYVTVCQIYTIFEELNIAIESELEKNTTYYSIQPISRSFAFMPIYALVPTCGRFFRFRVQACALLPQESFLLRLCDSGIHVSLQWKA